MTFSLNGEYKQMTGNKTIAKYVVEILGIYIYAWKYYHLCYSH